MRAVARYEKGYLQTRINLLHLHCELVQKVSVMKIERKAHIQRSVRVHCELLQKVSSMKVERQAQKQKILDDVFEKVKKSVSSVGWDAFLLFYYFFKSYFYLLGSIIIHFIKKCFIRCKDEMIVWTPVVGNWVFLLIKKCAIRCKDEIIVWAPILGHRVFLLIKKRFPIRKELVNGERISRIDYLQGKLKLVGGKLCYRGICSSSPPFIQCESANNVEIKFLLMYNGGEVLTDVSNLPPLQSKWNGRFIITNDRTMDVWRNVQIEFGLKPDEGGVLEVRGHGTNALGDFRLDGHYYPPLRKLWLIRSQFKESL
jgi:hypothetical protein